MAWSKDTLRSAKSEETIDAYIQALAEQLSVTHIAVSGILNSQAEATAESVSSFSLEPAAYVKRFADPIHENNKKVLFRMTDAYFEGIYDFPKWDGDDRYPAGDPDDVIDNIDRDNWLGRIYNWIINNPTVFADGDLWGIFPEATGHGIFTDATSFLPHDGAGIQTNYANFFINMVTVSKAAFTVIGKNVRCGFSGQNWSEINSGWLPGSVHSAQGTGRVLFSHYGTQGNDYSDTEMSSNLGSTYTTYAKPMFHMEWGDYWSTDPGYGYSRNQTDHETYLMSMYDVWQSFIDDGKLLGFNYWRSLGGAEAIMNQSGDDTDPDTYTLNYAGDVLENYFFQPNDVVSDVTYEGDYAGDPAIGVPVSLPAFRPQLNNL